MKENSCCFIGYRPQDVPWGEDVRSGAFFNFYMSLAMAIEQKLQSGCNRFYTSLEEGIDRWAIQIVLQYKQENPQAEVQVIAVRPNAQHHRDLSPQKRQTYAQILRQANEVITLDQVEEFKGLCAQDYLLQHCGHLIVGCDAKPRAQILHALQKAQGMGVDVLKIQAEESMPF